MIFGFCLTKATSKIHIGEFLTVFLQLLIVMDVLQGIGVIFQNFYPLKLHPYSYLENWLKAVIASH